MQVVSDKDIVVVQSKQTRAMRQQNFNNYNNFALQNNTLLLNKDKNLKQVLEGEVV